MSKNDPSKIAEKVWNNYEKSGKTFSHSLSQYNEEIKKVSIAAMNQSTKNEENEWNPTKDQFAESNPTILYSCLLNNYPFG